MKVENWSPGNFSSSYPEASVLRRQQQVSPIVLPNETEDTLCGRHGLRVATFQHLELFGHPHGSVHLRPQLLELGDATAGRQQLDVAQVLGQLVSDVHLGGQAAGTERAVQQDQVRRTETEIVLEKVEDF